MFWINFYPDGVLVEDTPGEQAIPLQLDERSSKALSCLVGLGSFEVASCLGQLAKWCLDQAGAANRKLLPSQVTSA